MIVYIQVFNKLIRRYKYLEKTFEEEIKKVTIISDVFYCGGCCLACEKYTTAWCQCSSVWFCCGPNRLIYSMFSYFLFLFFLCIVHISYPCIAASLPEGLHRVRADQTSHVNRHPVGQRHTAAAYPHQPLQW